MDKLLRNKRLVAALVALGTLFIIYVLVFAPPASFPDGKIMVVKKGESVAQISQDFGSAHLIAHPTLLRYVLRLFGTGDTVQAGAYSFSSPQSIIRIALRLGAGDYGIPPARVTLYEGMTVHDFATRVAAVLPEIEVADLLKAGKPYEGYLFPDTYVFAPGADVDSIIATLRANFSKQIATVSGEIGSSGRSLSDIITMASLIEREANTPESKKIVSGILWRRIAIGMPLQVDAVFGYIFDRATYSPSYADLKVNSPYNTYTHKGLPPTPISNPGLESIKAALEPTKTTYLYYLTGKDGQMHYASTYESQLANQRRYL